ncbi:endonuclease domain-containing protein [Methylomicrobium lacus]|uniref:endonuclease domain-containing protein n=1 Tax=Methylomicrobium lacus TaxID=136992 RepID=UPI00045EB857|nr:endonuclease domain-containing protein [Methylomicrobium lacus]
MLNYDAKLKPKARTLRSNMTDAEQRLWTRVRRKQILDVQFYRQKPLGGYIVDFYAPKASLVIELDGGQHFEAEQQDYDQRRTEFLQQQGLMVLRFTNLDVLQNIDGVMEKIFVVVRERLEYLKNPPNPLFQRGDGSSPDDET